jgi:hypothetical protein
MSHRIMDKQHTAGRKDGKATNPSSISVKGKGTGVASCSSCSRPERRSKSGESKMMHFSGYCIADMMEKKGATK